MKRLIKKAGLHTKMGSDIAWNMTSMIFVALSGLIYNTVFILIYDPSTLGLFNQALVYFLMFSQLAVFGIHFSVLKYSSEFADDREKRDKLFTGAIITTLIISIAFTALFYVLARVYIYFSASTVVNMLFFQLIQQQKE